MLAPGLARGDTPRKKVAFLGTEVGLPPESWSTSNGSPSVNSNREGLVSKRRTDDEVTRLLKDADRDLARGLTVSDFCRKVGVAQTTYHRWRKRHDPAQVDSDRRCRQLEVEVERLKRLVAELLLDKQMLQDVAKKKW
jgi:putative transposase